MLCLVYFCSVLCFLMLRRQPRSTRTDTRFPDKTLVRSGNNSRLTMMALADSGSRMDDIGPLSPPTARSWCQHSAVIPSGVLGGAIRPRHDDPMSLRARSEEHTSELQSLMRISYAVFCLKKKRKQNTHTTR